MQGGAHEDLFVPGIWFTIFTQKWKSQNDFSDTLKSNEVLD